MKAKYNKSKIMRNAWYMIKVKMVKTFAAALRKAWANEKRQMWNAMAENRVYDAFVELTPYSLPTEPAFAAGCGDYYAGRSGQYVGD